MNYEAHILEADLDEVFCIFKNFSKYPICWLLNVYSIEMYLVSLVSLFFKEFLENRRIGLL